MTIYKENGSVVSDEELRPLNNRQTEIYKSKLEGFADYLLTQGKVPKKNIGYAERSVKIRINRFHRVMKWTWNNSENPSIEFLRSNGDSVNQALETDSLRRYDGERYPGGTKRKFNDMLNNWFAFQSVEWEPEYEFRDQEPQNQPDPFRRTELKQLWEASLTFKSIPSYNNLTPQERHRWKAHIAQELGKPKKKVQPDDWDRINNCWKIPSIVRTTRSQGWRPDLIGRMKVDWYDPDSQTVHIPAGEAPKNDSSWNPELTDEGAETLENWLEQRKLREIYDGRDEIWLTREGNPYSSGTLNDLLDRLIEEAGINERGRKIVWYSFRHAVGTYVYEEFKSREIVAEQLRQKSKESASQYIHPLPETKREASNVL
ncbi:site-specific integrase [Halorubellus litoreus]|uniref:Tyrosine-type recombinase/integrase n=1 Tax=Halorubellus litoreus TaxID=755308 RepID=A0ABD5VBZ1_9EURY